MLMYERLAKDTQKEANYSEEIVLNTGYRIYKARSVSAIVSLSSRKIANRLTLASARFNILIATCRCGRARTRALSLFPCVI